VNLFRQVVTDVLTK